MYEEVIKKALSKASGEAEITLEIPKNPDYGDFTSNIALKVGQDSKSRGVNPRHFAGDIVAKLKADRSLENIVEKIEVAGPGFINFWLSPACLIANINKILEEKDNFGRSTEGKGKKVVVEYSSPNIAKRFGVGHLRSTVIGQVLYNLYKNMGYDVVGENHLGDWGTQFGALLAELKSRDLDTNGLSVGELEKMYVDFNNKAKENLSLWETARAEFARLEKGDPGSRKIWEKIKEISLAEFGKVYTLLGVNIDHSHGESFYEDKIPAIVKEVRAKNLSKKSEGAEIIELPDMPPAMLLKSDEASTYFARDLAALKYRIETYSPYKVVYEVGSDQVLHFRQVFAVAKKLGWIKSLELVHVAHGLYRFAEGKMSTRKGLTIRLDEVLDEAVKRAGKFNADNEVASAVGIGAVKYFDLMHHPSSDIVFDWDKVFVLEGNSGPYLQYSFVRTQSVLAKADRKVKRISEDSKIIDISKEEDLLLRDLVKFHAVLKNAAIYYSPNLLANYIYEVAQKFNSFYNKHKIIQSANEEFRLALTFCVGQVLKNGLTLLGIQTPNKM